MTDVFVEALDHWGIRPIPNDLGIGFHSVDANCRAERATLTYERRGVAP